MLSFTSSAAVCVHVCVRGFMPLCMLCACVYWCLRYACICACVRACMRAARWVTVAEEVLLQTCQMITQVKSRECICSMCPAHATLVRLKHLLWNLCFFSL
jgi:hypothetical protein